MSKPVTVPLASVARPLFASREPAAVTIRTGVRAGRSAPEAAAK